MMSIENHKMPAYVPDGVCCLDVICKVCDVQRVIKRETSSLKCAADWTQEFDREQSEN